MSKIDAPPKIYCLFECLEDLLFVPRSVEVVADQHAVVALLFEEGDDPLRHVVTVPTRSDRRRVKNQSDFSALAVRN
jgi:hypothetical protein